MGRLSGRTAVIVGGGQSAGETTGNGRAVAISFAREGASLLVVDRDVEAAQETVKAVRAEGGSAQAYQADILDPEAPKGILAAALDALGGVDILHNNVGAVVVDPTEQTSPEAWHLGLAVNLTGTWAVSKEFLPRMREQGHGVIINISSLAGLLPGATPYAVSKSGLNALTQGLALEYARHGVRVNAIVPGVIDTPMGVDGPARSSGRDRDAVAAARAALVPMGRQGTAWDIAAAAVFLASDEAAYITGVILPVDGGSTLKGNVF